MLARIIFALALVTSITSELRSDASEIWLEVRLRPRFVYSVQLPATRGSVLGKCCLPCPRVKQRNIGVSQARLMLCHLRWLLQQRGEGCTVTAVDDACWNGHEDVVRCLMCEFEETGSHRAMDYAASTGRLEVHTASLSAELA